ncbi:hypothetical protein C2I33_12480 [Ralstonia solanacearum]|nr:hypothetical protein C2I33_12480 [Ralstonia solanacearum]
MLRGQRTAHAVLRKRMGWQIDMRVAAVWGGAPAPIGLPWPRRSGCLRAHAAGAGRWSPDLSGARLMAVVTFDVPARVGWAKVTHVGRGMPRCLVRACRYGAV